MAAAGPGGGPQVNVFSFPALDLLFSFYSGDPANTGAPPQPSGGGLADLGLRAASGIVMVTLALGSLWAGGAWFTIFWATQTSRRCGD